ncbi:hypothetical protein FEDK69T_18700 [Flavobacterium enshiense DK69]|nr:hypothetical protein FEDK69T_18700 [Flavobacterium enshiense DK69]
MYYGLLSISIVFLLLLFAKIQQCEEESWGWEDSDNNIEVLLLLTGLFLFIEFIIFSIDGLILLIKKNRKKEVNNSELQCLSGSVLMLIFWVLILKKYINNGTCDIIIGPADTGLFLAMLASTIINFWKLKTLKKMENIP